MKNVYSSVIDIIGNTPAVKINNVLPPHFSAQIWAKLEYFNPGGSVKDRIALSIIKEAEKKGRLKPGVGVLVEATSGNTGVGLAMVGAILGYKCIFVMPDKISEEKRALLRAYGAEVIITPTGLEPDDPRSHYSVAKKIAFETPHAYLTNQYHNPANPQAHIDFTGPEIWEQFDGNIDVFVAGAGTGGSLSGIGTYLKQKNPHVKIVLADPVGSILFDLVKHGKVIDPPQGYFVEGVGEDMLPDNVHLKIIDDAVQVTDQEAFEMTLALIKKEGLCVGPSSALALVGAIKYLQAHPEHKNCVVLFADHGRNYLSKAFNPQWLLDNGFLTK